MKKIVVIGVIFLFIFVGFQSAFAVEPNKLSADNTQIEEDIEPKDFLFDTIIEIYNNPDVKDLFEENNPNVINFNFNNKYVIRQLLFKNPELLLSLVFSKPKMTTQYLDKAYTQGIEIIDIFSEEKILEMVGSVEITNPNLIDDLNNIIMNSAKLNNKILTLEELNENNEDICFILAILLWRGMIKSSILYEIWKILSPTEHPLLYKFVDANFWILVLQMDIIWVLLWKFECIEFPY